MVSIFKREGTLSTKCMICGDSVPIYSSSDHFRICDKCKEAIMAMREKLEKKGGLIFHEIKDLWNNNNISK